MAVYSCAHNVYVQEKPAGRFEQYLVGGTVDHASLCGALQSIYYWWARRQLDIGYLRLPSETETKSSSCSQFLHRVYYPQSDTKGGQVNRS